MARQEGGTAVENCPIIPRDNRVLIQLDEPLERTPGGLILPDTAKKMTGKGTVMAVGIGKLIEVSGERVPTGLEPGDRVMVERYAGTVVEIAEKDHVLVDAASIIADLNEAD